MGAGVGGGTPAPKTQKSFFCMITTGSIAKIRKIITQVRKEHKTIGFIPTMGALHAGHLSLVQRAKKECGFVVVSIFVNPKQFGPKEDFKKYPRTLSNDRKLLEKQGVDVIFCPVVQTMYPKDFSSYVEEIYLSRVLCGKSRPGHFKGVCTVVAKLFNIVGPDKAYFGSKDYQQAQIIKRMARDLNFPIKIEVLPIIRQIDGLAMSSRNTYLTPEERAEARALHESLVLAKKLIAAGERDPKKVIGRMEKLITEKTSAKIDYITIADANTLEDAVFIKGKLLIALAVFLGKTRLIDNIVLRAR
jgi:pantoate--beta-alanine ligase